MLKISEQQVGVFKTQAMARFEERVVMHLRRDLAEFVADFSDEQILERVRECVPRARAYGLTTEKQIMCFVDTTFLLGPKFDRETQFAWSRALLKSKKLNAADRANLLLATACSVVQSRRSQDR